MGSHKLSVVALVALISLACAAPRGATFATPDEAMRQLVNASHDEAAAEEILGPGGFSLLRSGDDIEDRQDLEHVKERIREKLDFEELDSTHSVAVIGKNRWEFPIPLVHESGRWHFDVVVGREEILNRRIGRNEISTIDTLRAIVEAQREFARMERDGDAPAFAKRIVSSAGRHDGLYWPVADGQASSPLGSFVAEAFDEGYRVDGTQPGVYHGYRFRLLTAQGASAPGGARSYLDAQGRLIGGFAVIAWPVTHGNSGVKTFLVNRQRIVFEKDLGPNTASVAAAISVYDPDKTWIPTVD